MPHRCVLASKLKALGLCTDEAIKALAEEFELDAKVICDWCEANQFPDPYHLCLIAEKAGISLEQFIRDIPNINEYFDEATLEQLASVKQPDIP